MADTIIATLGNSVANNCAAVWNWDVFLVDRFFGRCFSIIAEVESMISDLRFDEEVFEDELESVGDRGSGADDVGADGSTCIMSVDRPATGWTVTSSTSSSQNDRI